MKQHFENFPAEILEKPYFIPVTENKEAYTKGWSSEENWKAYNEIDGPVGFVISKTDYLVMDFDHTFDDAGHVVPEAKAMFTDIMQRIIKAMDGGETYTERSISGHGAHMIYDVPPSVEFGMLAGDNRGTIPLVPLDQYEKDPKNSPKLELWYHAGHQFVLTGNVKKKVPILSGAPAANVMKVLLAALDEVQEKRSGRKSERKQQSLDAVNPKILKALEHIPVASLPYQDWIHVGMALHNEGVPVEIFDQWSQPDPRYKEGEPERKYASFRQSQSNWNAGTIFKIAKEYGYKEDAKERKSIRADSAAELVAADIKPLEFMIPDLLPVGLSMLAAPPKFFKSYMALDMCIAVASGGKFLGRQCEKHDCLYLDLESTKRRPKARLEQILWGREPPGNLFVITGADDVGQVGNGFEDVILDQIRQHPAIRMIVVDVFQKIRPAGKRTQNAYEQDYEVMGHLKKLADELNIALLLIHHTRKARTGDAFDAISGSTGLMGSTDCTIMIEKEDRYADEGVLCITGRDLDAQKLRIRWNKFSFRWEYVGTDEEIREEEESSAYENSAVIQTVKKLVESFDGRWEGSASEAIEASKYFQSRIFSDAQKVGKAIKQFRVRLELDGISVREERRGHGSRKVYVFEKKPTALTEVTAPAASTASTETA